MSEQREIRFAMSRRRRVLIFILCLLVLAVLIWLDHRSVGDLQQRQPRSARQVQARDFERYHGKSFTVVKVVDGDTIDIDISDGKHEHTRIRLWGIDTPETKSDRYGVMYFGPQACEFTSKLVLGKKVAVYLDADNQTRGKYGRLLAYVQLSDERFLNEVLVAKGFAYADLRFRHSLYYKYQQLEASARSRKAGLWENVTRGQLPEWLRRRKPNLRLVK